MNTVKVGDVIWVRCEVGPPMVCAIDPETGAQGVMVGAGGGVAWEVDEHDAPIMNTVQGNEWVADHPVLPALAAWLAKWDRRVVEEMTAVLHEHGGDNYYYPPAAEMPCKQELFEILDTIASQVVTA